MSLIRKSIDDKYCSFPHKRWPMYFYRTQVSLGSIGSQPLLLTFLNFCWCDSCWWWYQLNTAWSCFWQYRLLALWGGDGCHWDGGEIFKPHTPDPGYSIVICHHHHSYLFSRSSSWNASDRDVVKLNLCRDSLVTAWTGPFLIGSRFLSKFKQKV